MDPLWRTALWQQFSAAIDMLENALVACPSTHWKESLWPDPVDHSLSSEFAQFWRIAYHTLFWLDLYLSGSPEEEFTPSTPFIRTEPDIDGSPKRSYAKEDLHAYLAAMRQKCHDTLVALTDEQAHQGVEYPWMEEGQSVSFLELQLYNMRHVQEHAAQLNLFLGQNGISEASDWVSGVTAEADGE